MGNINRDPDQILSYVKESNDRIEHIAQKVNSMVEYIEMLQPDLNDKNCQAMFRELAINSADLITALRNLLTENSEIEADAKHLKYTVEGGMGGYIK